MMSGGSVRRKYHLYELFSLAACCLCFFGCGLQEYYVVEAPFIIQQEPKYDSEFTLRYFDFKTNETKNPNRGSFVFLGTAVYYKIYNRHESVNSVTSALSSANYSTDASSAARLLKDTYTYKQLGTQTGTVTPLIASNGTDRRIYIRLTNYQTDQRYQAKIIVDYDGLDSSVAPTNVPKREGNRYSFDFGRDGDNDSASKTLSSTDPDYNYSSSGFSSGYDNTYFVDMYAVSVGRDENYTEQYSKVLHLGTVAINASSKDN